MLGMDIVKVGTRNNIPIEVTPGLRAAVAAYLAGASPSGGRTQAQLEALRAAWLAVDCPMPFCRAAVGNPCLTQMGYVLKQAHSRRRMRAETAVARLIATRP